MFSEGMTGSGEAAGRDDKQRRQRRRVASIAVLLVACSPSQFALREREASRELEQAEHTEARTLARYELTQSRLFLAKAREAASEAHYALALDLAERASESARRARTLAIARGVGAE